MEDQKLTKTEKVLGILGIVFILAMLPFISKGANSKEVTTLSESDSKHELNCEIIEGGGFAHTTTERCENKEVVCYRYNIGNGGGISCIAKGGLR